ncbi:MAG: TonB-dependent receptor [Bacteroidota bacterium]|nr:TonB-dependent receptor [Bacteroidota bacterium]
MLFQRASVFGLVFGNGSGVHYIPNGASVNDEGARQVTVSLQPEQISTWEAGYKGTIAEKLYIDINGYYGKSKNFLSPAITVGGRALSVGDIPIDQSKLLIPGTVNSSGQLAGAAFLTYFNYGEVTSYGVDLGVNYYFSGTSNFTVKYSWFGSDITEENIKNDANRDGFVSLEERNLNAPRHRVVAGLNFQNLFDGKAYLNIGGRWIQQYDFYSGSQIGTAEGEGRRGVVYGGINPINNQPRNYFKNFNHGALGGFTTFDLSTGYKFSEFLSVGGSISNIFDTEQREFVGSPSIGRLYSVEVKATIPTFRK